jgi:hypothetical protein
MLEVNAYDTGPIKLPPGRQTPPDQPAKEKEDLHLKDLAIQSVKMDAKTNKEKYKKVLFCSGMSTFFSGKKFVDEVLLDPKKAAAKDIRWLNEKQIARLKDQVSPEVIADAIAISRSENTKKALAELLNDETTLKARAKELPKQLHERLTQSQLSRSEKRELDKDVDHFISTLQDMTTEERRAYVKEWDIPANSPLLKNLASSNILNAETLKIHSNNIPKRFHERLTKSDLTLSEQRKLDKEVEHFISALKEMTTEERKAYVKEWVIPPNSPLLEKLYTTHIGVICEVFVELYAKEKNDSATFATHFLKVISMFIDAEATKSAISLVNPPPERLANPSENLIKSVKREKIPIIKVLSKEVNAKMNELLKTYEGNAKGISEKFAEALFNQKISQLPTNLRYVAKQILTHRP